MTFIKKMPKTNKITSFIAVFFLYLFTITDYSIANSNKDTKISKKLWHEFSNSDKINFKEIKKYIRGKKYGKALNLCHNFAKNSVIGDSQKIYSNFSNNIILAKKDYSDAICRYIQWQQYSDVKDVDDIEFSEISKFIENNKF